MCRSCGAIVGAGESTCAVCGASTSAQTATRASHAMPDRETLRFARALMERPYKFTIILLVTNLFVYMLMWQSSGMRFSVLGIFTGPVLVAYGAKLNSLIEVGQWWRFVTPIFIHVNLLHLLVNMYSLWIIGPYVEKLYGGSKFVFFWVLTGIAGVIASYLTVVSPDRPLGALGRFIFKIQDEPSAGASGALFGLVGVLFVFGIKFRHELPEGFKRAFGIGLLPMIVLNLFIGYIGRGIIDNAAHLGGLAAGAALALVVDYRRPGERSGVAIVWQVLRAVVLTLVAISFVQIARHFRDASPASLATLPIQITSSDNFVVYVKAMNEAQEAFYAAIQEDDLKPSASAIQNLNNAPYLDEKAHELRETIRNLLLEAATINAPGTAANNAEDIKQKKAKLIQRFGVWVKDYNEWLKTAAKRSRGLIEVEPEKSR